MIRVFSPKYSLRSQGYFNNLLIKQHFHQVFNSNSISFRYFSKNRNEVALKLEHLSENLVVNGKNLFFLQNSFFSTSKKTTKESSRKRSSKSKTQEAKKEKGVEENLSKKTSKKVVIRTPGIPPEGSELKIVLAAVIFPNETGKITIIRNERPT